MSPRKWRYYSDLQGNAFYETTLVLPLLIIFTFGVVDLGRWITLHQSVSRLAYEGARFGSGVPGLGTPINEGSGTLTPSRGQIYTLPPGTTCNGSGIPPEHCLIIGKVQRLIETTLSTDYEGYNIPVDQITIRTMLTFGDPALANPNPPNSVWVNVSLKFEPLLLSADFLGLGYGLANLPSVHSSSFTPYLFPESPDEDRP